ncbi:MAG: hypothetical protein IIU24_06820, partial [Selenomonas sp.]|nr:hypothetical protein [Selenomonas sp.]
MGADKKISCSITAILLFFKSPLTNTSVGFFYCGLTVKEFLNVFRQGVHGVHGGVIFLPPLN